MPGTTADMALVRPEALDEARIEDLIGQHLAHNLEILPEQVGIDLTRSLSSPPALAPRRWLRRCTSLSGTACPLLQCSPTSLPPFKPCRRR